MEPYVRERGPLRGELGNVIHVVGGLPYYEYTIRSISTGEVLTEGYAGGVQEAVQVIDLFLDFFLRQPGIA